MKTLLYQTHVLDSARTMSFSKEYLLIKASPRSSLRQAQGRLAANDTLFILLIFKYLQCYFLMKLNFFTNRHFTFFCFSKRKRQPACGWMSEPVEGKKKRPRKPTTIFSFTQNQPKLGLKKLQFALFVDIHRTAPH